MESNNYNEKPKVSIVLLGYNRASLLPKCIESLKKQEYTNIEIIYVDDASTDNSVEVAKSYGITKIIQLNTNLGFGPANNEGVKIAEGKFVFFISDDMYIDKNCISNLVKEISKSSDIFAVDPSQYNWDGELIHGCTVIKKSGIKNWFPFISVDYFGPKEIIEIPWGCAGSIMIRTEMFNKLEGFDPTFFMDGEDLDLCWRAWMMGWKTIYVPDSIVHHKVFGGITVTPDWRRLSGEKNFMRFVIKLMNIKWMLYIFATKILQGFGFILLGKFRRGLVIFKAIFHTIFNLKLILKERQKVISVSKYDSDCLFKKFID